ncbi:MAG TPA: Isoquinoline 1-oxidoreductase subunit [Xanthobacteraceae bacterium]|jgi:hypothetical protein
MTRRRILGVIGFAVVLLAAGVVGQRMLRQTQISDETKARSIALFREAGKVLQNPRCLNCHPVGDRPTQTDRMVPHQPWVVRGVDGHGAPGLHCDTCHHAANFDAAGVPGNPGWRLAPAAMGWQGRSLGAICVQIKDPARNGGKDMAALLDHVSKDSLVGWAWSPGGKRPPAPGTQAAFGALMRAWADTGAHCPPAENQ